MRARAAARLAAAGALLALPGIPGHAQEPAVAQLTFVDRDVERARESSPWTRAEEGSGFGFGDDLRASALAVARLRFPWMSVTAGPETRLALPDEYVVSLRLDAGRVALDSPEREILKLRTPEARVRGVGRVVVRREESRTLVMAHAGRFRVDGDRGGIELAAGQGTVVRAGQVPAPPAALPPAPAGLLPGDDAVYVGTGEAAELRWSGAAPGYWIEVLPVGSDEVLLQRDAAASPHSLTIPWPGAFRWRVASRDRAGLEGLPSADGLICVVEK